MYNIREEGVVLKHFYSVEFQSLIAPEVIGTSFFQAMQASEHVIQVHEEYYYYFLLKLPIHPKEQKIMIQSLCQFLQVDEYKLQLKISN